MSGMTVEGVEQNDKPMYPSHWSDHTRNNKPEVLYNMWRAPVTQANYSTKTVPPNI